ncbi:hypothetical protein MHBO_001487 [Bonamia ostreae]|uniref:ATP synthase mitochondrial F1 complex assembly factor 1 n=1 Tax=Bonamia ostreae TaxID=126728 RepID=A0ABV2AJZ9_9EUKA
MAILNILKSKVNFKTNILFCTKSAKFSNRQLNDIVDLRKLESEDTKTIEYIWEKHHSNSPSKCSSTLNIEQFEKIMKRSKIGKRFVFPVPTGKKFFVVYSEFQDNFCIMTSLEAFRLQKGDSYPYFILSFYDELIDSRDISLVRGQVLNEHMNIEQGKYLMEQTIGHYLDDKKFERVRIFNTEPKKFDLAKYFKSLGFDYRNLVGK